MTVFRPSLLPFAALAVAIASVSVSLASANSLKRHVVIRNESGAKIKVFWVNSKTLELVPIGSPTVADGATFQVDSFVGHQFEVQEVPSAATGLCLSGECGESTLTVSENDKQVYTVTPEIELEYVDDEIRAQHSASELIEKCKKSFLRTSRGRPDASKTVMDDLLKCIESSVTNTLVQANEEIAFQASIRKSIAGQMENFTCTDPDAQTTPPVSTSVWDGAKDGVPRTANILLDRPASRIHVVENFIDQEECDAMAAAAKPKLHHATVADGKGGSHFSEHRKAMQAGIKVQWHEEKNGNPIARLSRKVYDYTEHVLGLGIEEHGQEDLMSIQYFGRGTNDTAPDRYTPHCDGECTGLKHKTGTRMATMVMYCDVPEVGGHTNFRNAGVHVKPQKGNAIFFGYINPKTLTMDDGFTEHSGCPVYQGEKRIVTQWIRLGVDKINRWDTFNTLGVKRSAED